MTIKEVMIMTIMTELIEIMVKIHGDIYCRQVTTGENYEQYVHES